jgi:hypothetical protein
MLGLEERNSKVYLFSFFLLQQIGQDYFLTGVRYFWANNTTTKIWKCIKLRFQ